ncbi:hypothetical protein AVL61_16325 [Kocuria rosea subsp. polaris]|uniref:Uncharacterized protein n=1 Tax=Kocuria rosea subsp. polaris TaxID=136273 RepID=A0A0W8IPY4_KOCRO|nr:hypothetical protein [Kocuria polaris]KUG62306.1 hypothetical protein AVL61_16325 [Kocuria polaris]
MRIFWSAVSLTVVAALALLLWSVAGDTDRVEIVRDGVSVSGTPAPGPSPGAVQRSEAPSAETPVPENTSSPDTDNAERNAEDSTTTKPADPLPDEQSAPVDPAPPAQVPLPVQPAPADDDWDDDWGDDWDDD